ncbi:unnamed protein product [Moneuplotes crassus]|uniref:Uncharacterized protein n=1 Tax=Euplotes crassus TaxID=5936 RepID=A0AAD1UA28_EUPCR|nr:unnamed protein product [Moneuplotes crassus]
MSFESIDVPNSSHERVVIPSNSTLSGFLRNCYLVNNVPVLVNLIKKKDFDTIIHDCSCILSNYFTIRSNLAKGKIHKSEKLTFLFSSSCCIAFLIMSYYLPRWDDNITYLIIWAVLLSITILVPIGLMVVNTYFKSNDPQDIHEKMIHELETYIEKANHNHLDPEKCVLMLNHRSDKKGLYLSFEIMDGAPVESSGPARIDTEPLQTHGRLRGSNSSEPENVYFEDEISSFIEEKKAEQPQLRTKKKKFGRSPEKSKEIRVSSEIEENFEDINESSEIE